MNDNNSFTTHIARTWHRPMFCSLPRAIVRLIFGQMMGQELFLNSIKVLPARLIDDGFCFRYDILGKALMAIKNKEF
jgi:uncharacterized protein